MGSASPSTSKGDRAGSRLTAVLFTDLDGTLLDADTYEPGPSLQALVRCGEGGVEVVFVSSKTRAEMEAIRQDLGNEAPFIYENGGGMLIPADRWPVVPGAVRDADYWAIRLGTPFPVLTRALRESAREANVSVLGFDEMSDEDVAEATGLTVEKAGLARAREFDLPFIVMEEGDGVPAELREAVGARGLQITRGGRFHHIMGGVDKGRAVERLRALYGDLQPGIVFAAVGDAALDRPMLEVVERPFLVRRPDGSIDEDAIFDGLHVTDGNGPEGFEEAVDLLLAGPERGEVR
ncbi:HAD-IIB family hydrolase [Thermodesulfobacteriota bacterium]